MSEVAIKEGYKKTKTGWIPDEWDEIKFGDIPDKKIKWSITGGPFGSDLKSSDYTETGVRILQLQNLGDGKFIDKYKIYTSAEKANALLACNIFPNELILSKMGDPVARACFIPNEDERYLMASDGIRLVPDENKFDKKFVLEYINFSIFRKLAIRHSTGSTRQRIGLTDLKKLPFVEPPLKEQKKIAQILTTWDTAIEKTEQLLQQLQLRKKGLMQQLLSGKKRLKGFEEEWKVFQIQEIGKVIRGASPRPKGDPRYYGGNVPRLMVADVTRDGKFVTPKVDFLTEEGALKSRPCKKGTLTVVCSGTVGIPSFLAVDACIHDGFLAIIDLKENLILDEYLFYHLFRLKEKLERSATHGGVFTNLTTLILKEFEIKISSIEEQKAIASILNQSDLEIKKTKTYLAQLQAQKKGLMQQLLTGQKRVKVS